jgi:hypothetical protein
MDLHLKVYTVKDRFIKEGKTNDRNKKITRVKFNCLFWWAKL